MTSVVISRLTSPTSDTLDFTGLSLSGYRVVTLAVWGLTPGTDDARPQLRVSQSSSFISGASDYAYANQATSTNGTGDGDSSGATTAIWLANNTANFGVGNAAGESFAARIEIVNRESGEPFYCTYNCAATGPSSAGIMTNGSGRVNNSTAIDGLRILMSAGTMPTGKAVLIGHT